MKKMLTASLLLSALLLSAAAPLFQNGKSEWKIVIPAKPHMTENYAAEEFRDTLKKVSGVTLPIEKTDAVPAKNAVVIGTIDTCPAVKKLSSEFKLTPGKIEQIAIFTRGGNLYLAGNMPRAALYAVYTFLKDQLGCRWFWDGPTGEYITPRKEYTLPDLAIHYAPPFRFRVMSPVGMHRHVPTEIWMARSRVNGDSSSLPIRDLAGAVRRGGSHTVCVSRKDFDKHPDWFSMIDGKRRVEGYAGCWSNPEYFQYLVKKHVDIIRKRNIELLCAFPADIMLRCQCPECTKNPDKSSRWFDFYYKLTQAIAKECPDVEFAGVAYQEYRAIPTSEVRGLIYVDYCQYNRCYVHKLDDPNCPINQRSMSQFKLWQAKAPMAVYGYEFDVFKTEKPLYYPFWNMTADAMKHFRDMKLVRVKTEMSVNQRKGVTREDMTQQARRIGNYMYAQQLWDPDVDVQTVLKDFCDHVYGAGGKAMYAYHTAMADSWDKMKLHLTYFHNTPDAAAKELLNPKLVKNAKKWFADAVKAIDGMKDEAAKKRAKGELALEKIFFERWLALYEMTGNQVTLCLPKLTSASGLSALSPLPMIPSAKAGPDKKGEPTELRMGWTRDGLVMQVVCMTADMKSVRRGGAGRNGSIWGFDNIEIFLDTGDGVPYYHFAVGAGGGIFDAKANDGDWSADWTGTVKDGPDRWTVDIQLPFKVFGKTPKDGDYWKIIVLRNSKPVTLGYPQVAYRDLTKGSVIVFSEKARLNPNLVWITSPKAKTELKSKAQLIARGWQTAWYQGAAEGEKADLSKAGVIWIETFQNKFSKDFYQKKLIPAVRNGAVLIYQSYSWIGDLPKLFDDPSFAVVWKEDAASLRRPTWVDPTLNTVPNKLMLEKATTPSSTFVPKVPDKWTVLGKQNTKSGQEKPFIIARPYGKGMIVITGGLYGKRNMFLDNIVEYAKTIKRDGN
ncbi:MAG: DUF4838 domain-containing protein [Lentisphaeria bacterium]|nr:DUF4838 domain-containing protein [Lentisphaeria bacterium]